MKPQLFFIHISRSLRHRQSFCHINLNIVKTIRTQHKKSRLVFIRRRYFEAKRVVLVIVRFPYQHCFDKILTPFQLYESLEKHESLKLDIWICKHKIYGKLLFCIRHIQIKHQYNLKFLKIWIIQYDSFQLFILKLLQNRAAG